ncbi:hypothetical protein ACFPOE_10170 [Caenimonas terrae]|uniref:Uncharacterized protein n=1 Tax=Caenimonas terrae TaxID=696074 RepID=A0ABW0NFY5_9BURK
MLQSPQSTAPPSASMPQQLSAGYALLQDVDEALRHAEMALQAAHRDYVARVGPRPDTVYREVVRLREQARVMLDQLADLFLGEEQRGHRQVSETRSRQ